MKKKNRKKTKLVNLEDKLNDIYNSVDLRTTCCRSLICCLTACPQMNFVEFSSLINKVWDSFNKSEKIELICNSIEYFFKNEYEKFGMETLQKKCLLLDTKNKKCKYYDSRPLSCRLYGLWPDDDYKARVDRFEKAYDGLLKREELPLNVQCPYVRRVDQSKELTSDVINNLFVQLDVLDAQVGNFSELRIKNKENYRTFHDWLLLKTFGEEWLIKLTTFMLAAKREVIEDQIKALKDAVRSKFAKDMPDIRGK